MNKKCSRKFELTNLWKRHGWVQGSRQPSIQCHQTVKHWHSHILIVIVTAAYTARQGFGNFLPRESRWLVSFLTTRLKLTGHIHWVGYHPWFSPLISTTSNPISKDEHYRRLFLPDSVGNVTINSEETNISPPPPDSLKSQFATLLTHLPNPRPLSKVLIELRQNLSDFSESMLGKVGLPYSAWLFRLASSSYYHHHTFST